jgi:hypothetical protein
MLRRTEWPTRLPLTLVAFACLAALVLTLWLPFGWKVTGLYEEWFIMRDADAGNPVRMLYVPPYASASYRPLTLAPFVLGYLLTPSSFLGLNIVAALIFFGKGAAMYSLVRRLVPDNPALAFVSAALLVVYPADDALLTLRTTNVHAGVFFLLIALNLFIVLSQRFRWTTLLAMLLAEAIALATYEGGLLLMLGTPVLLVWIRHGIDKRLLALTALWAAVPIYFCLHLVLTLRDPASYPAELLGWSGLGTDSLTILRSWLSSVTRAYIRNFGTGWYRALRGVDWHDPYLHLSAGLTVFLIVPALWLHTRRPADTKPVVDTGRYLVLASLGVGAVLAGFAMYLPTAWRNTSWRVFIYSSIGAALAVGVACFLFARLFGERQRVVFVGLTSVLIAIATLHALAQHHDYFEYTQRQQQILADIITRAPHFEPGTTVLLVDRTPTAAFKAWSMCTVVSICLEAALRYIYGDHTLRATYCAPGYRPRNQSSEECRFEAHGVTVSYTHPLTKKETSTAYAYASLVVFENSVQGLNVVNDIRSYRSEPAADVYEPGRRIDAGSPIPPRARTVFTRWPFRITDPRSTWRPSTTTPAGAPR